MRTTKENMTGYLEKFQMFQRMLQGVAHVSIEMMTMKIEMMTMKIDLIIFPLDEGRCYTRTINGDVIMRIFSVSSYNDKEENDKVVQEAHKYVKNILAV